jgi:hypothetical protein
MLPATLPALRRAERCFATATGVEIIVLSAFGDESADETGQRVFAVAVVIGSEDAWRPAESAWVARTGGAIFHATDCESEFANDPDRSKHPTNQELYKDLTNIIASSYLFGGGMVLDLMAYREYFPGVPDDTAYYKCFTDVIRWTAEAAARFPVPEPIEYTFDCRLKSAYNSGVLYDMLVNMPEWKANIFMRHKLSFAGNKNPRIQMADLVARETMKWLDNEIGPRKRPLRKSMAALAASNGFFFEKMDREYCARWRDQMPNLMAQVGFTEQAYAEWLGSHGLDDNITNRLRYLAWLQNKGLLS